MLDHDMIVGIHSIAEALKNPDREIFEIVATDEGLEELKKRGWKIIGGGILLLILGFVILSFTDSHGQNWASDASPFVLIGGYALIGFGIIKK